MRRARPELTWVLIAAASIWLSQPGWTQQSASVASSAGGARSTRALPDQALTRIRPGTVQSTYENGKLTVMARNAPLIDVLYSACAVIGADVHAPEDADQPILRVAGPASPREVLVSILSDSRFGYAISKSDKDPSSIASITIFPQDTDSRRHADAGPKDKDPDTTPPGQQLTELVESIQATLSATASDVSADTGRGDVDNSGGTQSDDAYAAGRNTDASPGGAQDSDPEFLSRLESLASKLDQTGAAEDAGPSEAPSRDQSPGGRHRHTR
jgi:hypothetical protein